MVVNRKVTGTASSMPGGLTVGAAVSMAVTLAGSLIAAHLISKGIIGQQSIGYCSMIILLLSAGIGAKSALSRTKRRGLLVCAAAGLIYYLLLLSVTALFFGGIYDAMGATALVVFCGSMLVALMEARGEGSRRRKRNSLRHR